VTAANGHRFDLNAKRRARVAAANESAGRLWEFEFGDPPQTFAFKAQRDWPATGKRMLEDGDYDQLIDKILDKPKEFWACEPTMGDVEDLFTAYGEWTGVGDLPESAASPPPVLTPM
jgi:hypothetical protein